MKLTFTPIISGLSGRAADAVAASWKGIAYIRKYVIPANPQSAAQTLVRESFTRCVTLWRSLSTTLKDFLDSYGSAYKESGFNTFMSKCRALEQAASLLKPVPDNPYIPAVADFAYASEPVAGSMKVDWTNPATAGYTKMALILRQTLLAVFQAELLTTDAAAATYTFAGLTIGKTYQCYGWLYNPTTKDCGTVKSFSHTQLS